MGGNIYDPGIVKERAPMLSPPPRGLREGLRLPTFTSPIPLPSPQQVRLPWVV